LYYWIFDPNVNVKVCGVVRHGVGSVRMKEKEKE